MTQVVVLSQTMNQMLSDRRVTKFTLVGTTDKLSSLLTFILVILMEMWKKLSFLTH